MSFPSPPVVKDSLPVSNSAPTSNSHLHPSLPARPSQPLPSFKNNNSNCSSSHPSRVYQDGKATSSGFSSFGGFKPRSLTGPSSTWQSHPPAVSAPPAPPSAFSQPRPQPQATYTSDSYHSSSYYSMPQNQTCYTNNHHYAPPTAPQIQNPFPLPGNDPTSDFNRSHVGNNDRFNYSDPAYDPEMEAQIAQWQTAYSNKDDNSNTGNMISKSMANRARAEGAASAGDANALPLGTRANSLVMATSTPISNIDINSAVNADTGVAAVVAGADGKQKTVVRSGGGKTWQDPSLLEWDPAHFRLFVGNLAGEVTDESLLKAFSRYTSVQKARVVRDKRTTKSQGYGFVSFSDGDDYFQAAKNMQGKYIGSHPVLIKRSTTEIRPTVPVDKKKAKFGKGGHYGGSGSGSGGGVKTGAGVHKKQSRTKGGLRILG